MSSRDHTVIVSHNPPRRRKWSKDQPPYMCDLRIVLLGKSVSENSRVGNFLLGRAAFDSEAPPDVVERVGGRLKDRHVMVINSPRLLQTNISDHQIIQTVSECVCLSDPGPHVIVLLLKHEQCSAEDQECVQKVLDSFSERVYQHTMVLTTQEPTETNDILQKIIQKCSNRHFSLQRSSSPDDLLQVFEDIVQMNDGRHLDCAEASQYLTKEQQATERLSEGVKLNLVVCGSDGTLKSSISEQILRDVELHGRLVSLEELPALIRLSEEEVMRQTLRCVSLCDPGVHVFLLIIPDAPLSNEDKAEMEEIQRRFSSRINKHMMILIMQNSERQTAELNEETQAVIGSFGGRHHVFGPTTQVSTLMESVEKMLEENKGEFFSTETFLEAQMEKLMKYEEIKKKIDSLETRLLPQGSTESEDDLRIVLLGKTGVGKSATGNTILGREAFTAEESFESVTSESQRESSEINGRHVTVIDTPGLFDTELTNEEIQREISNCISMILPGPHVFLLLIPLGRFTNEEQKSVKIIQEMFGEKSLMFTIVLFTRGDDLKKKTIDQCLGKPGSVIRNLIEACGNRFHVFNNNETGDRTQVSDLLEKIDNMVEANGGSFYSCKMFRQMERQKQEQQMKILMDRVREREEEMRKLEEEKERMIEEERQNHEKERKRREEEMRKLEEEKERMKMRMEEERQNHEKERKRREEELKREIREQEKLQREIQDEMRRERETFKHEIKEEKEKLQIKYDTEIDRIENERKKREDEYNEREERYKREMKEKEEREEKMREEMKREREEWEKQKLEEKMRREEEDEKRREKEQRDCDEFNQRLKEERERMEREKEDLQSKHEAEENKMKMMMEEERQNQDKERKRREEKFREKEERYKREMKEQEEQMRDEMKREREMFKDEIKEMRQEKETVKKEKENLQIRYDTEIERLMKRIENERQNNDKEKNTREEESNEREERFKKEMKEREELERKIRDEMRRERDTFKQDMEEMKKEKDNLQIRYDTEIDRLMKRIENERQNHETERNTREEDRKMREREKQISDEQIQRLNSEMEGIIREKERIERERRGQLEDLEKRLTEERNMREDQQKTSEEKLKLLEEELKRRRVEWREEYEREKEEKKKKKICSESDHSLQVTAYRKLETKYSKWTWSLRSAMMETENKLHNKIENGVIHEVKETDLQRELKTTSEEVEKSMSEFFEKDTDKDILIQWKTSFEIKVKYVQENIVRETKRKLNEFIQQRDLKKKIDAQRTRHENTLYEKSKELALKLKDRANDEETLKREFDLFWEQSVNMIISDTPLIRDIDIMRDVREILSDVYGSVSVDHRRESRDILTVRSYSDYVQLKKSSGFIRALKNVYRSAKEVLDYILSQEDEAQIRSLVTDVVHQTDRMIQSFNISKMGYNISFIQQLTGYIEARLTEHEEESVKYVFKKQFFMDLVLSICKRANKTITDQHRLFREANDPVIYVEKKRTEYYSVFQKYCHGSSSAVIFGEIICQKLKEPIEQSVYKRTARDLTDEMRSNCPPLNGNRSNLEKHILKTLAEEEDFDKYMNYIHNPRDHFKSFIRDEVRRYITDKFSVSVLPKMKENIKLLERKIMEAVHESTEHVQENRGDVGLWLKSFTQRLSDELIFSDLSGVKHDDVDVNLLEDVMRREFPAIMSEISRRFNTETFPVNLDYKFRPDELLIDLFCQCCWVQCPFCGAVCTNTTENHPGDHSAPVHRINGLNGCSYKGTTNLQISICTTAVAGNQHFYPNYSDDKVPYREYRRAGGVYADWSITPDLSELKYWKWFVCRFQKHLEKHYSITFEGQGKIPDEWRRYTKQDAIESLDQYM